MKAPLSAALALLALAPTVPEARQEPERNQVERAFKPGGRVAFDLSAGAYTIRGSAHDSIRVRWRTDDPDDARQVKTEIAIKGTDATVRTRGPKNNFRVEIDLPQRSDMDMNLSAGDLRIRGIEGNKTLSMWAGDVTIEIGTADLYRRVDASVRFGELTLQPFNRNTGGVLRSFSWTGSGKYTISARLFAGDLKLLR